jgi:hypothetical protein
MLPVILLLLSGAAHSATPSNPAVDLEMQVASKSFPPRQEQIILACRPKLTLSGACLLKLRVEAAGEPGEGAPGPLGYFEAEIDVPRALAWTERLQRLVVEGKVPPAQLDAYNTPGKTVRYVRAAGGTLAKAIEGYWFDGDEKLTPWATLWEELRKAAARAPRFAAELACRRGKSPGNGVTELECDLRNVGRSPFMLPPVRAEQARVYSLKTFQSLTLKTVAFEGKPPGSTSLAAGKATPFRLRFTPGEKLAPQEPLRLALDLRQDLDRPDTGDAETGSVLRVLLYSSRIP